MFPSLTNIVLTAFIACLPVRCYQLQPLLRHALYPVSQISRVRFLSITHFVRFRAWIVIGELWLRLLVLHTSDVIPCFQCFQRGFVILCEDYATLTSSRCYLATGANDENRTRIASLEGWSSTIEPHPHLAARAGLEPATYRLTADCTTIALTGHYFGACIMHRINS